MVREVTTEEVQSKLDDGEDVTVVDIRSPEQFAGGHVPGAINVPLPELPRRVEEHDWDAAEVVTVCPIGQSSIQAARLLGSYEDLDAEDVASMAGGYREWDGELESGAVGAAAGDDGTASASEEAAGSATDEGPSAPF